MPQHVVNAHLQSARSAGRSGRRQISERRLPQIKLLQFLAAVTAAQHFIPGFTVRRSYYVAIDPHRVALVTVSERRRENKRCMRFVAE